MGSFFKKAPPETAEKTDTRAGRFHEIPEEHIGLSPVKSMLLSVSIDRELCLAQLARGDKALITETALEIAEHAERLACRAGVESEALCRACTGSVISTILKGRGATILAEISAVFTPRENAFVQISFKHYMSTSAFYNDPDATSENHRTLLQQSSVQKGAEEDLDEIKYFNGVERSLGKKEYFFKKIIRTYAIRRPKKASHALSEDFIRYIDTIQNCNSAIFVRMDHFSKKKDIVISEDAANCETVQSIMSKWGYAHHGTENYNDYSFSFFSSDITAHDSEGFDAILGEMESIIARRYA